VNFHLVGDNPYNPPSCLPDACGVILVRYYDRFIHILTRLIRTPGARVQIL